MLAIDFGSSLHTLRAEKNDNLTYTYSKPFRNEAVLNCANNYQH